MANERGFICECRPDDYDVIKWALAPHIILGLVRLFYWKKLGFVNEMPVFE